MFGQKAEARATTSHRLEKHFSFQSFLYYQSLILDFLQISILKIQFQPKCFSIKNQQLDEFFPTIWLWGFTSGLNNSTRRTNFFLLVKYGN